MQLILQLEIMSEASRILIDEVKTALPITLPKPVSLFHPLLKGVKMISPSLNFT